MKKPLMDGATTVWLVRHASAAGTDGRCCGRLDVPLSPEGIVQARETAARLAQEKIAAVYSSGLRRALETGQMLADALQLDVTVLETLAEIDFGDFEGMTFEEIQRRYPEAFERWMTQPTNTRFPNGESFADMRDRVSRAVDPLLRRHRNESIAIVSHSGVIRFVIGRALSMPADQIFRLAQRHCAINRIKFTEEGPIVELMNG
jgi:alpha-ribazole phosphatase/probable phosphoglycerate mutase